MFGKRIQLIGMFAVMTVSAVAITACGGILPGTGSDEGGPYELTLEKINEGELEPEAGTHEYDEGVVDVTARPAEKWYFGHWKGDVDDPDSAETTVTLDKDKTVTAQFVRETNTIHNLQNAHNKRVWSVEFSPDNSKLIAGGDYPVRVWDLENGEVLTEFDKHEYEKEVFRVAFSPDGEMVASGGQDDVDRTLVWDPETGSIDYTLTHAKGINSVAFSPDSSRLAAGGNNESLLVWELDGTDDGNQIAEIFPEGENDRNAIESVGFITNNRVYAGVEDETVKIWNIEDPDNPDKVMEFTEHAGSILSIDVSSDNSFAVSSAQNDDSVRVWDVETGEVIQTFDHGGTAQSVAFSADGSYVLSAGGDSVRLWEVETGNLIADYRGHDESVWAGDISVAGSIDDIMIASGDDEGPDNSGGEIKVWELK